MSPDVFFYSFSRFSSTSGYEAPHTSCYQFISMPVFQCVCQCSGFDSVTQEIRKCLTVIIWYNRKTSSENISHEQQENVWCPSLFSLWFYFLITGEKKPNIWPIIGIIWLCFCYNIQHTACNTSSYLCLLRSLFFWCNHFDSPRSLICLSNSLP